MAYYNEDMTLTQDGRAYVTSAITGRMCIACGAPVALGDDTETIVCTADAGHNTCLAIIKNQDVPPAVSPVGSAS